jgi:hypothetical protein
MELLCDVGQVESYFGPFWRQCLCRYKIGARIAPNIPLAQKSFWTWLVVVLGDEAQVEAQLSPFEDSDNLGAR